MSPDPNEKTGLDKAIDSVLEDLDRLESESEEFQKATDQLVKLHAMKMAENSNYMDEVVKLQTMHNESRNLRRVSPDTLLLAAGNLLGILVIVGYEQKHIVSSKALGFLGKLIR